MLQLDPTKQPLAAKPIGQGKQLPTHFYGTSAVHANNPWMDQSRAELCVVCQPLIQNVVDYIPSKLVTFFSLLLILSVSITSWHL